MSVMEHALLGVSVGLAVGWHVLVGLALAKRCGLYVCVCVVLAVADGVGEQLRVRAQVGVVPFVTVLDLVRTAVAVILLLQLKVCATVLVGGVVVVRLRVDVD